VQFFGDGPFNAGIGTMLRPIATPLSLGGFDPLTVEPWTNAFRENGFVPVMAGGAQSGASAKSGPLRPGDPVGVALMSGDLSLGATGTVTHVDGNRVYGFGHPFYNLGPTQIPMTRAYVHTLLPSLFTSMKIASTGEVIGTVQQDRATAIAGTLGAGPALIPINLTLTSDRGQKKTFKMAMSSPAISRRPRPARMSWRRSISCCGTCSRTSRSRRSTSRSTPASSRGPQPSSVSGSTPRSPRRERRCR
jgi:hypothetical protein